MTDHLFNKKEIINLIVDFCIEPCGVLKDDITGECARFISAGYTVIDEEYTDYYVLNDAGKEMLLRQVEELESELVAFMGENDGKRILIHLLPQYCVPVKHYIADIHLDIGAR